ncbi:ImmA/IrrE family metallo-endopeptidase [Sporosarcina sp. FSL W7-1349]|uniref:ImmA/IrrE family metallo-endopeptidase n=1 Tax=Sporosarcina sp. FSL W7-1349 TaxID=2921561 RepID=UPI0030FBACED
MYINSHLEDYIKDLYLNIGIKNPGKLNQHTIARRLNIWLYPFNGPSEAIYSNGRQYIFLNRNLTPQEQWQEFAHELCHILRHSGNQKKMARLFLEYQEWQADSFASHFCIPTFMLRRLELPQDRQKAVWKIQQTFNVTNEFAELRLKMYENKVYSGVFYRWI